MLTPPQDGRVYIFTREHDRDAFVFEGIGHPVNVDGERPVKIVWELESRGHLAPPGEVAADVRYVEGATRQVTVLVSERDPAARRKCIAHHGCVCAVCGIDFAVAYGELGEGFIHVHHLKPLSAADGEREIDPVEDLRPVCPNCHAMLHMSNPPLDVEELVLRVRNT